MYTVKEWLQDAANGSWVMVIDNVDDVEIFNNVMSEDGERVIETSLSSVIPKCAHGSILFTSRDKSASVDVAGAWSWIHVDKMIMNDGRCLLRNSLDSD